MKLLSQPRSILIAISLILGITTGIATPSSAQYPDRNQNQQQEKLREERKRNDAIEDATRKQTGTPIKPNNPAPSNNNNNGSDAGDALAAGASIFLLLNPGLSYSSSNSGTGNKQQYGILFNIDNGYQFKSRTSIHFGSGTTHYATGVTFNLFGGKPIVNPFVGGGIGAKTFEKTTTNSFGVASSTTGTVFSPYGSAGVDLNLTDWLSVSGTGIFATDDNYGSAYQLAVNFLNFW